MCHWLPQTPELQWPVLQGREEDLLEMPGGLHLGLEEEEVGVGLQGNKSHDSWSEISSHQANCQTGFVTTAVFYIHDFLSQ